MTEEQLLAIAIWIQLVSVTVGTFLATKNKNGWFMFAGLFWMPMSAFLGMLVAHTYKVFS